MKKRGKTKAVEEEEDLGQIRLRVLVCENPNLQLLQQIWLTN
jgi:hypothetical protein